MMHEMMGPHEMTGEPLVVFIHHPKAGGTSLHDLMKREYGHHTKMHIGEYWSRLCEGEQIRAIGHHYTFGLHRYIPDRPVRYITCLRRSLPRQVSNYYYAVLNRNPRANTGLKALIAGGLTLEGYLSWWQRHADATCAPPLPWASEQARRMSARDPFCDADAALADGLANLELCECVGVQERYDEWVQLCRVKFGWSAELPAEWLNHATPDVMPELPGWVLRAHEEYNRLDDLLWERANELLTEQRRRAGL